MKKLFLCLIAISASAMAGDAPTSPEALAQAYKSYYEQKNCDGILSLVYQEGLSAEFLSALKNSMCANFSRQIEKIDIQPPKPHFTQPDATGKIKETTLPVTGNMQINLIKQGEQFQQTGAGFPIGQKDGHFYIVTLKPMANK